MFLNHARGQDVVSKLRAALEYGDTAYCDTPLFGTGRNLESLHSSLKADAGIQADKNTHMWRNYRNQVLAAER